jgi:hypothetical protein
MGVGTRSADVVCSAHRMPTDGEGIEFQDVSSQSESVRNGNESQRLDTDTCDVSLSLVVMIEV